jgi:hypothetical protein
MSNGTEITIQSEDVGTIIKGTAQTRTNGTDTVIDINDLSTITVLLRDPDGVTTNHTATAVNVDGGTDGIWSFTTATAIFSLNPGVWYIQAKYTFSSGNIFYSNTKTLNVGEVLS